MCGRDGPDRDVERLLELHAILSPRAPVQLPRDRWEALHRERVAIEGRLKAKEGGQRATRERDEPARRGRGDL